MNLEELRSFCLSLPNVTEDIKWESDLCFCIGGKMFCVTNFNQPMHITIKVNDDEFNELVSSENIKIADYVGRYKWITILNVDRFNKKEWQYYIGQSYQLIKNKLPKKIKESLD